MAQAVTEKEITPYRTEEEKQALAKHPHALDFQFSPADLVIYPHLARSRPRRARTRT
jgi:hypothetical protein